MNRDEAIQHLLDTVAKLTEQVNILAIQLSKINDNALKQIEATERIVDYLAKNKK